jgi:hypothetical protein
MCDEDGRNLRKMGVMRIGDGGNRSFSFSTTRAKEWFSLPSSHI